MKHMESSEKMSTRKRKPENSGQSVIACQCYQDRRKNGNPVQVKVATNIKHQYFVQFALKEEV